MKRTPRKWLAYTVALLLVGGIIWQPANLIEPQARAPRASEMA